MFNKSKYTKWYFIIIRNARSGKRIKLKRNDQNYVYYEKHHIIPKSLGGNNEFKNLVLLTAREHFICHLLLPKMCIKLKHKDKMNYAAWALINQKNEFQKGRYINSRFFESIKQKAAESQSNEKVGKTLEELHGVEKAYKIRQSLSKRKPRTSPSNEERKNISERIKKYSVEKPWIRNAIKLNQCPKILCNFCNKHYDLGNYKRWHDTNCKHKQS